MNRFVDVTDVVDRLLSVVEALDLIAESLDCDLNDGAVYLLQTMSTSLAEDWERLDEFLRDERLQKPFRLNVQVPADEVPDRMPRGVWTLGEKGPEYRVFLPSGPDAAEA